MMKWWKDSINVSTPVYFTPFHVFFSHLQSIANGIETNKQQSVSNKKLQKKKKLVLHVLTQFGMLTESIYGVLTYLARWSYIYHDTLFQTT